MPTRKGTIRKDCPPCLSQNHVIIYYALALDLCFGRNFYGNHAAVCPATVFAATEANNAVYQCVERVVAAHTYILAGVVGRTALANDDVAGDATLSSPNLNA